MSVSQKRSFMFSFNEDTVNLFHKSCVIPPCQVLEGSHESTNGKRSSLKERFAHWTWNAKRSFEQLRSLKYERRCSTTISCIHLPRHMHWIHLSHFQTFAVLRINNAPVADVKWNFGTATEFVRHGSAAKSGAGCIKQQHHGMGLERSFHLRGTLQRYAHSATLFISVAFIVSNITSLLYFQCEICNGSISKPFILLCTSPKCATGYAKRDILQW